VLPADEQLQRRGGGWPRQEETVLVKIRLKRMGTTKRPFYRLVVADSRSPRDGRFIEALGFYDPLPRPASVRIDEERVREWLRRGARPSDSARDLLIAQGILPGDPRRVARAPEAVAGDGGSSEAVAAQASVPEAVAGDGERSEAVGAQAVPDQKGDAPDDGARDGGEAAAETEAPATQAASGEAE